jgi:hypothetical protein
MTIPLFVQHRVNTIAALHLADTRGGVEIDLRSHVENPGAIHLSHDPWTQGESFSEWLSVYAALGFFGPLILNTKEDGLENKALELLARHSIIHFFFLDTTLPTLRACLLRGLGPHMAVRLSSVEPKQALAPWFALMHDGQPVEGPGWIWVDCFDGIFLDSACLTEVAPWAKLCLVSPELQKVQLEPDNVVMRLGGMVDAICTKHPKIWRQVLRSPEN